MHRAYFQFYDELNYFLPRRHQHATIEHGFTWRASVKDMIESLGVPHAEIELIVANNLSVDFNYVVLADDRIDVYPRFESIDLLPKVRLRPPMCGPVRFVLDQHLGRLAAYLRMIGFDTLYRNDYADDELAQVSHADNRVLLTRDIGLLKRSLVTYGYYVRETNPQRQLGEIVRRWKLADAIEPFKHCMKCNGLLHPVAKETILDRLPEGTARYYDEFHCCASCAQIYWKGPHYQRMQSLMAQVLNGEG